MSFANPNASNVIVQSDRDADLSGLVGNTGVTITEDEGITYYDFGQNRLAITGGLSVDPEKEVMIFHHDHQTDFDTTMYLSGSTRSDGWKYGMSFSTDADGYVVVNFTSTLPAAYIVGVSLYFQSVTGGSSGLGAFNNRGHLIKSISGNDVTLWYKSVGDSLGGSSRCRSYAGFEYGKEYIANNRIKYSKGTGIFFTGYTGSNWNPRDACFSMGARTHFRARGGTIVMSKPWSCGASSYVDWDNLTILNTHPTYQIEARGMGNGLTKDVSLVNTDIGNFVSLDTIGFKLVNGSMMNTYTQYYELPVRDADVSENTYDYDFGTSTGSFGHVLLTLTNCSDGTKFRPMWRKTTGTNLQNACEIHKDVKIDVRDTGNSPIEDVQVYTRDYPSIFAKHVAIKNKSPLNNEGPVTVTAATPPNVYMPAHGYTTGDCVMLQGFANSSGTSNGDFINGYKKVTVVDADNLTLHYLDGTDVVGTVNHTQELSINITAIVSDGAETPKIKLTVDSTTGIAAGDKVYVVDVTGSISSTLNGVTHTINSITGSDVVLNTNWPGSNNGYTSGGDLHKFFANRLVPAIEYDHTTTHTYSKSTAADGTTETFPVMIGGSLKEYHPAQKFATRTYGGPYVIDLNPAETNWLDADTGVGMAYADWDTSKFDNYFRMDRRGVANNQDDIFKFCFCKYEKLINSVKTSLVKTGTLTISNVMTDDQTITANESTTQQYTTVDTPEIFYDVAKYWLQQNYTGQHETIVDRQGDTILAKHNHVVLDDQAATVFNYVANSPSDVTTGATIEKTGTGGANNNHPVDHLINNNTDTGTEKWLVSNVGTDTGVIISGLESCLVTGFKIFSGDVRDRDPKRIIIYGSNNGTSWTQIIDTPLGSFTNPAGVSTFANINNYADGVQQKTLFFENTTRYTSYKIVFPEIVSGTTLAVQELELLGTTIDGTITVKSETFVGNIGTDNGDITLQNDTQIVGTYGDISVLPYTLTNIEAGSTIQLYNMETARAGEIVNTTVGGDVGTKVTHTGTYANSLAEPGDEIRLRVTCQSGTTALLPYEVFGVAQSSGISFKVNQQDDTIYNANGIDGSDTSITDDFTADYTNLQIDSTETDGVVTVQEIYAFYAYSITTSTGIDNFFGAITPIDGLNYRINTDVVDLKIQNTTSVDTILKGGRLYRDDNGSVIDTDSTTGAGSGSFTHDTGFLLQYIAPQVENAVVEADLASNTDMNTVKSDVQSIKNNTSVIPGLL